MRQIDRLSKLTDFNSEQANAAEIGNCAPVFRQIEGLVHDQAPALERVTQRQPAPFGVSHSRSGGFSERCRVKTRTGLLHYPRARLHCLSLKPHFLLKPKPSIGLRGADTFHGEWSWHANQQPQLAFAMGMAGEDEFRDK